MYVCVRKGRSDGHLSLPVSDEYIANLSCRVTAVCRPARLLTCFFLRPPGHDDEGIEESASSEERWTLDPGLCLVVVAGASMRLDGPRPDTSSRVPRHGEDGLPSAVGDDACEEGFHLCTGNEYHIDFKILYEFGYHCLALLYALAHPYI